MPDASKLLWKSATFVVLRDTSGSVLLHRRFGTPYLNGFYDLPSGHVEQGESIKACAAREALEETGVTIAESDLELFHINQFDANDEHYYNFVFIAHKWQGSPTVTEPDKCDDMKFFALDSLPEKLTPATKLALETIDGSPVSLGYIDQQTFDLIVPSI